MNKLIIELQYFGTITWYLALLRHDEIIIEKHENFEKSTYRNRCYIASPEGRLRLTVPLQKGRNQRSKYSDVQIDYESGWQRNHWNSLCSCYRNSPYFEYYEDRLQPLYEERNDLLFDFNLKIFKLMVELLGLDLKVGFTSKYEKTPGDQFSDFRSKILPKEMAGATFPVKYHQVFQEKTGFLPDLCIADLLFNEGPHASELLIAAVRD